VRTRVTVESLNACGASGISARRRDRGYTQLRQCSPTSCNRASSEQRTAARGGRASRRRRVRAEVGSSTCEGRISTAERQTPEGRVASVAARAHCAQAVGTGRDDTGGSGDVYGLEIMDRALESVRSGTILEFACSRLARTRGPRDFARRLCPSGMLRYVDRPTRPACRA
jgi:hypothetical protein